MCKTPLEWVTLTSHSTSVVQILRDGDKNQFYLILLNVTYVLTKKNPKKKKTDDMYKEEVVEHGIKVKKWGKDHICCPNYLINCILNDLYDYYD